jgi:hypothetical protein
MAVSVVNGYFCANSCDAAKAKKGEDPHPSTDPGNVDGSNNYPRADHPAVMFGGSLSNTLPAQAVGPTGAAQPSDPVAARRTGRSRLRLKLGVEGRLDPAVHSPCRRMDARVKHDSGAAPLRIKPPSWLCHYCDIPALTTGWVSRSLHNTTIRLETSAARRSTLSSAIFFPDSMSRAISTIPTAPSTSVLRAATTA